MLRQQMRSCDSVKIEAVGDSPTDQLNDTFCCLNNNTKRDHGSLVNVPFNGTTDTSSIALTNNDIVRLSDFSTPTFDDSLHIKDAFLMRDSLSLSPFRNSTPTLFESLHIKDAFLMQDSLSLWFPFQRSSVEPVSCLEYCSQATACIATSFGDCRGRYTTALDQLQYIYSYIYSCASSIAITQIILFFVLALLMPTTNISTTPSIISPSPHISRSRSFTATMTNYTAITRYTFFFTPHPTCPTFGPAMNNAYSEDFDPAVVDTFFTDTARTTVIPDVVTVIRAAIIDTVMLSTTAQRPVFEYYSHVFSRSTACIATRYRECSFTLLDTLWYLYSYIYKPTTTICYGIFIFLNSRHTSPLRLLPSVKHTTTPSTSLPLFTTRSFTTGSSTTRSTLQLSILLESTSAPSFSIPSGPFFVNFIKSIIFLSLAAVDNEDNNPKSTTRPDIRYELKPTVPSFPLFSWPLFVVFFLSPIGTVTLLRLELSFDTTNILRIRGTVCYLYHLQIYLFTLHDASSSSSKNASSYTTLLFLTIPVQYNATTTIPLKCTTEKFGRTVYGIGNNTTDFRSRRLKLLSYSTCTVFDDRTIYSLHFDTVIAIFVAIATTVSDNNDTATAAISISLINSPFHIIDHGSLLYLILQILLYNQQYVFAFENDNAYSLYFDTVFDGRTGDNDLDLYFDPVFDGRTGNNDTNYGEITVSNSTITMRRDSIIALFDTADEATTVSVADEATFDTTFDTTFETASHASPSFDTTSSTVVRAIVATIFDQESSADNDSPVTVTMTTQVYSTSSSSLLELSNNYVTFSENMARNGRTGDNDHTGNNNNNYGDFTVSNSIIVTLNTYDTIYDLYFNTVIAIIVAVAPAVAVGAPSAVKMKTNAMIFITLLRSHIIDHGSLLYLTQQILLYNQQYVYDDSNNDSVSSVTVTYVVTMKIISYELYVAAYSVVAESFHELLSVIHGGIFPAFTIMTTIFDDRTGNNDLDLHFYTVFDGRTSNTDGISSAAIADKAQYDDDDGDTAVSRASPSIVIDTESSTVSVTSNKAPSTGNNSLATVTLRTYDTVHILYFDTTFDAALDTAFNTAIDTTFTSASHASSSYDIDTDSSAVSVADEATFATVTIMYTDILTSSESSAVSIPTQLPINILEPCFTCFRFYLRGSRENLRVFGQV